MATEPTAFISVIVRVNCSSWYALLVVRQAMPERERGRELSLNRVSLIQKYNQQYNVNKELYQTLDIIEGLCNKAKTLAMSGEYDSDLQKAIVGIIRGSEFAFEELTGVKYNTPDPEDTIPN